MSEFGARPQGWVGGLLLGLVFVVALEGMVRVEELVRFGTPVVSPFHDQAQLFVRDADGMHGRPNARFEKWVLNGNGMRGPEASERKAPGTYRIITVGASETFGLYERPGREYPRQLEDSLEAMRRDGRCGCPGVARFEVLNAAMLGMTLPTARQDVRNRLRRFGADAIVVYPTPPAYLSENVPTAARPDSSGRAARIAPTDWVYPRVAARLREQTKTMLPSAAKDWLRRREIAQVASEHPAGWQYEQVPEDRLAQFESDVRQTVGVIHEVGARPVLISHANAFRPGEPRDPVLINSWVRFYPRASGDVIVDFDDRAAARVASVAADSTVPFVDWHAEAPKHGAAVFRDFSHFSDAGAGQLARLIAVTVLPYAAGAR